MTPGLVSHVSSTHRFEPSLSNSWMSCPATASRCALLAPTRWSMHAFLFLFPVSFRAGFGLFAFVQCLFRLGLPFFQLQLSVLARLFQSALPDVSRHHPFAAGFRSSRPSQCRARNISLLLSSQLPRALRLASLSVGPADAPFSLRRLFGSARHGLLRASRAASRKAL